MTGLIKSVSVHGVPRSGTSWLGQIFNSHPLVAYRHQPLFSHRFKDMIAPSSDDEAISRFLEALYACKDDEFLSDRWTPARRLPFEFEKALQPSHLVMKMVRYHHLIERLLAHPSEIRIVGIVRHPCGVIHSWVNAPREFDSSWSIEEEWRYAQSKNRKQPEEFYGAEKWLEVARLFSRLEEEHDRFALLIYENLVADPVSEIGKVFEFCGLDLHPQVINFIKETQCHHETDPYAIIKNPDVANRWRDEMDDWLIEAILQFVNACPVGRRFT